MENGEAGLAPQLHSLPLGGAVGMGGAFCRSGGLVFSAWLSCASRSPTQHAALALVHPQVCSHHHHQPEHRHPSTRHFGPWRPSRPLPGTAIYLSVWLCLCGTSFNPRPSVTALPHRALSRVRGPLCRSEGPRFGRGSLLICGRAGGLFPSGFCEHAAMNAHVQG